METQLQNQGYLYTFSKNNFEYNGDLFEMRRQKKDVIMTLIADDHPYLIHGVESDLGNNSKIKIIGTASSYDEVKVKAQELNPDVVLLDLRMPGWDRYDLKSFIAELKSDSSCKVIIFSNETGWARIHRCLDIGASAYIEKAISIGRLAEFITRVYENSELVIFTAEKLPKMQFSRRQKEILHYIADGMENDQIAKALEIEIKTVQSYVNEIKSKFAEAFCLQPIRPRTLLLLASKLGFGTMVA